MQKTLHTIKAAIMVGMIDVEDGKIIAAQVLEAVLQASEIPQYKALAKN
jgi:hypothetical protein